MIGKMLHHKYRRRGSVGLLLAMSCSFLFLSPRLSIPLMRFLLLPLLDDGFAVMMSLGGTMCHEPPRSMASVCVCGSYDRLLVS